MTEMNIYFSLITLTINGLDFLNQKTKINIPSSLCTIAVVAMDRLADALKSINSAEKRGKCPGPQQGMLQSHQAASVCDDDLCLHW